MRYRLWIFVLTAVAVAATACKQKIGQEAPLRLENGGRTEDRSTVSGQAADNSRCHVCHGSSDAHCSDENNITPPDIMYSKASVNPSCMKCHPKDEISEEGHHKPLLSETATQTKYCTDCHGRDHRVAVRSVRWDKTTGKLIEDK